MAPLDGAAGMVLSSGSDSHQFQKKLILDMFHIPEDHLKGKGFHWETQKP